MPSTVPAVGRGGSQQALTIVTVFIAAHVREAPAENPGVPSRELRVQVRGFSARWAWQRGAHRLVTTAYYITLPPPPFLQKEGGSQRWGLHCAKWKEADSLANRLESRKLFLSLPAGTD